MLNSLSETITDSPVDAADPSSSSAATSAAIVMTTARAHHRDGAEDQRQGGDVARGGLGGRQLGQGLGGHGLSKGLVGAAVTLTVRQRRAGRGGGPGREGRRSQAGQR